MASSNISGGRFAGEIYNTFVGSVGVEFFIFLSGVGLYFSMTKDSRVRYFFQKRLKRILPTYLTVAVPYWIAVDIVCKQRGWTVFAADISFVTFFAHGTRTFWYVLFIGLAYLTYPAVYKVLHTKHTEYFQLVVLIMTALLIQLLGVSVSRVNITTRRIYIRITDLLIKRKHRSLLHFCQTRFRHRQSLKK